MIIGLNRNTFYLFFIFSLFLFLLLLNAVLLHHTPWLSFLCIVPIHTYKSQKKKEKKNIMYWNGSSYGNEHRLNCDKTHTSKTFVVNKKKIYCRNVQRRQRLMLLLLLLLLLVLLWVPFIIVWMSFFFPSLFYCVLLLVAP